MDRKREKQVSNAGGRPSCKPAGVCAQETWRDLLRVEPESASREGGFPIDETEGILFALARAVEQRDRHTAGHCERLAFMSVAMGIAMRFERTSLLALYRGGYLHDVGKVGIPDSILFKPGKLDAREWVTMRSHTTRGEEICRHLKSLGPVLPVIRHHHERWDGSGYPDGLRGAQIPLLARVLQIADIYDALTSPRPYKPAYPPDRALQIIEEETSRGWRDPEIVTLFFRLHEDVISKIAGPSGRPTAAADRNLEAMQESLANLQQFLVADSAPAAPSVHAS